MDDSSFVYIVLAIALAMMVYNAFYNKGAIIRRKLRDAESKPITQFKDGETAKLIGYIEIIGQPLIAPLSKRECSYYHIVVRHQVSSGKNSRWETIIEEEKSCKYLIRDGDSFAFIDDKKVNHFIVKDGEFTSGFLNNASGVLENYLNSKGEKSENFLGFNKTLEYKEGILEKGEKIAVLGKGVWKNASDLDLPEKYGKILHILPSKKDGVYLSDHPNTVI